MLTRRLVSETVFASTHTTLQHSKSIRQDYSQDKSNLSPEFDGHAGEPGDKASWLV